MRRWHAVQDVDDRANPGHDGKAMPMLEVRNLSVAYGGLRALSDVSLSVEAGQFVTVVGPNGAGRSTMFKTICGIVPPVAGSVSFRGENLLGQPAASRAHLGIAHVPEGRQVFKT